jgi:8-oxo-dGTP pyrophosphatase MutT (NUDIX family)
MHDDIVKNLKNKLPKCPNILKKRYYYNSAVLIPFIKVKGEYCLLFELRAQGIHQDGEICFPGGRFEKGKDLSFADTAIRETVEELGIPQSVIEIIGQMDTLITPYGVTVDSFPAIIHTEFNNITNYDRKEVAEIFTVPLSFFINNKPDIYKVNVKITPYAEDETGNKIELLPVNEIGLPKRYNNTWHSQKHPVVVYKYNQYVIWGITANLIEEMIYLMVNE